MYIVLVGSFKVRVKNYVERRLAKSSQGGDQILKNV